MTNATIITKDTIHEMLLAEEKSGRNYLGFVRYEEQDGWLYGIWEDKRTGEEYAVRQIRTMHMGFN